MAAFPINRVAGHYGYARVSYGKAEKIWSAFAWSPTMAFMPYQSKCRTMRFYVHDYEIWENKFKVLPRTGSGFLGPGSETGIESDDTEIESETEIESDDVAEAESEPRLEDTSVFVIFRQ